MPVEKASQKFSLSLLLHFVFTRALYSALSSYYFKLRHHFLDQTGTCSQIARWLKSEISSQMIFCIS